MKYETKMKIKIANIRTAQLKKQLGFLQKSWKNEGISIEEFWKRTDDFWARHAEEAEKVE